MQNFNFKTRKMMNQATAELFHTTAYVEDYLDCIESLPNDLQRSVSQMREADSAYRSVLKQTKQYYKELVSIRQDVQARKKVLVNLQRCLLRTQELGDEKLHLSTHIVEMVENRLRQMDVNKGHVEMSEKPKLQVENSKEKINKAKREAEALVEKSSKRLRRHKTEKEKEKEKEKEEVVVATANKENGTKNKKKKRAKAKVEREPSPVDIPIDPNEPTYCLCNQVSYGEMVGCDNKDCPYEWFHFGCVGLTHKPKGKWYCPKCIPEVKKK